MFETLEIIYKQWSLGWAAWDFFMIEFVVWGQVAKSIQGSTPIQKKKKRSLSGMLRYFFLALHKLQLDFLPEA